MTKQGGCGIISYVLREHGGMAQSVEHIVHIDGVVGSSPTVTTTNTSLIVWSEVCFFSFEKADYTTGLLHGGARCDMINTFR